MSNEKSSVGVCPRCGKRIEIGTVVGAKIGGAALGALAGRCATEHWLGVVIGAAMGAAIGHAIDVDLLPRCPTCRIALEVLNTMI